MKLFRVKVSFPAADAVFRISCDVHAASTRDARNAAAEAAIKAFRELGILDFSRAIASADVMEFPE